MPASLRRQHPIFAPVLIRWTLSVQEIISSRTSCCFSRRSCGAVSLRKATSTRFKHLRTQHAFRGGKFPWLAFARGLARTSGPEARKTCAMGDRDKISLEYTLLPYLTALIEQDKIDPSVALGLLRLSDPAELYVCGTQQLAEVIADKRTPIRRSC